MLKKTTFAKSLTAKNAIMGKLSAINALTDFRLTLWIISHTV